MSNIENDDTPLAPTHRRFLMLWAAGLVLLFALVGSVLISATYQDKLASNQRHKERIDPNLVEAGQTPADSQISPGAQPTDVLVGIYLDRIVELSIQDTGWTTDFYLWFEWTGDKVKPGDNFQLVDASIERKDKEDEYVIGDKHYELYRVTARITKFFDPARFPRDDHLLTISLEQPAYKMDEMRFIADEQNSSISSRVSIPGYKIYNMASVVKPHSYKTTRGDPRLPVEYKATYSQYRFGIWISRPDWGYYLKLFQALYVAVGIALLVFFIKPTDVDPRFGLGVGGLFAAVANAYISSGLLPNSGTMTLTDMVNGLAVLTIFITLVASTISLYIYDRREEQSLSRRFDKVSVVTIGLAFIVINIILPLAASL